MPDVKEEIWTSLHNGFTYRQMLFLRNLCVLTHDNRGQNLEEAESRSLKCIKILRKMHGIYSVLQTFAGSIFYETEMVGIKEREARDFLTDFAKILTKDQGQNFFKIFARRDNCCDRLLHFTKMISQMDKNYMKAAQICQILIESLLDHDDCSCKIGKCGLQQIGCSHHYFLLSCWRALEGAHIDYVVKLRSQHDHSTVLTSRPKCFIIDFARLKQRHFLSFLNDEKELTLGSSGAVFHGYDNKVPSIKDTHMSLMFAYECKITDLVDTFEIPQTLLHDIKSAEKVLLQISHYYDRIEETPLLLHGRSKGIQRAKDALGQPTALEHKFKTEFEGENTPEAEFTEVYKDVPLRLSLMSRNIFAFEWYNILEIPDDSMLLPQVTYRKMSILKAGSSIGFYVSLQEKLDTFLTAYRDVKDSTKSVSTRQIFIKGIDQSKNEHKFQCSEDYFQSDDEMRTIQTESNPENSILCISGISYTHEAIQANASYNEEIYHLRIKVQSLQKEIDMLREKNDLLKKIQHDKCTCEFDAKCRSEQNSESMHKDNRDSTLKFSSNNNQFESESSDCPKSISKNCQESMGSRNQTESERRNSDDYISFRDDINGENCSETVKCPQEKKFDTAEAFENSHVTQMENRDEVGYISHDLNELLDASEEHDSIVGKREDINNDNSDSIHDSLLASEKCSVSDIDENVPEYTDVVFGVSAEEMAKKRELLSALSTHSQSPDVTLGSLLSSGEFQHVYSAGYASPEEICQFHCEGVEQNGLLEIREEGLSSRDECTGKWLSEDLRTQLSKKLHVFPETSLEDKTLDQGLVKESLVYCNQETDKFLTNRSLCIAKNAVAEDSTFDNMSTESSAFASASRESPEVNDKPGWNSLTENTSPEQSIFEVAIELFAAKQISSERTALGSKSLSTECSSEDKSLQEITSVNDSSPDQKPFVLDNSLTGHKTAVDMTSLLTTPFVDNISVLEPLVLDNSFVAESFVVHETSVVEYTPLHRPSVVANTSVLDTTVMKKKSLLETLFVDNSSFLKPTVVVILFVSNITVHKPLDVYMESKHDNPIVVKVSVLEHFAVVKKSQLRTPCVNETSLLEPSGLDQIFIMDNTSVLQSSDVANKYLETNFIMNKAVKITSLPETLFIEKVSPIEPSVVDNNLLLDNTFVTEMLVSENTSLLETPFVDNTAILEPSVDEKLLLDSKTDTRILFTGNTSLLETPFVDKTPILEPSVIDITLFVDNRMVLSSTSHLEVTRESSPGISLFENDKISEVDSSPVQCSLTDGSVLNHSVEQKTSFPCSKQGNKSLVEENNSLGCELEENGALQCSEEDIKQVLYSPEGNQSLHDSDEGRTSVRCSEEDILSLLCSANDSKSSQSTGENEESHHYLLKDNRTVVNPFPVLPRNDSESALKLKAELRENLKKFCLKFEIDKSTECKSSNQALLNAHLRDKSTEDLVIHFFKSLEFENVMKRSTRLQKLCNDVINHYFRYLKCYYEAHVFPAQLPRTGLDGYFQRVLEGEEMTYRDKMQYEWLRIQSFWSFPINIGMSMIYLARNGFYYTGRSTECRCYFCGHTYNDWEATDNNSERIIEIHRRISPNCVFLTDSSHNNVPIHQESPVSFAFGEPPPREPRTAIEGSVPSPPGAVSEATGLSDHAQASASAALLPNFPASSLPAPSTSTSGQASSVSSAPVSAQSSTATAAITNQPLAPSVTASSSSGLPPTSQPTASQSGATFLVEPSPTISMPPASSSSEPGPSDPLQHAKPLPQRDKLPSPGQQSHDNIQGSGAPPTLPTTPSQAPDVVPHSVPIASGQGSGSTGEATLPGAQSSAGRRDNRWEAADTRVLEVPSASPQSQPDTTHRVVYQVTLHLSTFHYAEGLSDPNNPEFLRISGQITPVLEHLFQSIAGDQRINIIRFIPNPPVLIVFDLESYNFSDEAVLRSVFDQAIQKGSIAVYRISPEGFEFRLTEESNLPVEGATGQQQQALSAPATSAPATSVPATSVPATSAPATSASATSAAATSAPATNQAASSASGQQNAPETGRQRMGTSTTAPPRPQRFDPLGINFDRPRYPAYAVLTVRNGSYSDWPTSLTQEPLDMALAGFFYAGYGDYVRCFFCGGGLRNWDDGDDPWVEHAKWFPRCAFVRQNKGEKFVNDIQRRHHEQGAGIEFEEEIEEQIPDEELPAYRSLIEMNYSPETVQRAIETFRQRIRPGRQAPLPMSATNLADIIFEFENGNSNSNIAEVRQSEGEEVERTTEGVRSASHATEGIRTEPPATEGVRTEPPATEGVKTSSPATEDVRIESPSETTPGDVAESGRISEEERRAEQTKLLNEASALESTSSQEGEGDLDTLKEENISLKEKLKCKVCLEKDVAVAFLPCGHLVCCTDCAPAIRICIICNEMVKGTVKTFFP